MTNHYYDSIATMDRPAQDTRYSSVSDAQLWGRTAQSLGSGLSNLSRDVQRWVEVRGKMIDLHDAAIKSYSAAALRAAKKRA